ncbi:Piso0_005002 [Millerozyma farinosa CBS 7064]|uniref:Piso0_005002 protein n=1 Tax=Pichia sorbitophila (strain ATCC MYA-4447 / BCRC 22081 / CBS 7064 / NBRC 10061 / NRRL Y-12695) TaxID=559304 RepID=G8Y104_PICSO|nr:Piso0_005002 [Millerozyma farinosa CBS 7064]
MVSLKWGKKKDTSPVQVSDSSTVKEDGQEMLGKEDPESKPVAAADTLTYDGGYGWVIVFAVFLNNFSTWGLNSAFAIYFSYYMDNRTFAGASKLDYSAIGGLALGAGIFCSPIINYIQGLVGTRGLIVLGNCMQFAALFMASYSVSLWELYMTQGVLQSFGMAFIALPSLTLIPQYFKKKRIFSGGIATAGSGIGGIVFNLGMQKVIEVRDVHWALRAQAIIAFGLVWVSTLLIRTRNKHHRIQFTIIDKQCLSCVGFWILCFYAITCIFAYGILLYTLPNFTTSLGYSAYQGSIASAMVQLGSCLGRPVVGYLADRYGIFTVPCIVYLVCAIFALAMWIPARNYATVIVFAIIEGALMGSIYSTVAPMVARIVGMSKMNVAFCMLWVCVGSGGIVSPVIGLSLTDTAGGVDPKMYLNCSIFTGVAFFASFIGLFILRGYLTARDSLTDSEEDADLVNHMSIKVPPLLALQYSLKWNIKV